MRINVFWPLESAGSVCAWGCCKMMRAGQRVIKVFTLGENPNLTNLA